MGSQKKEGGKRFLSNANVRMWFISPVVWRKLLYIPMTRRRVGKVLFSFSQNKWSAKQVIFGHIQKASSP